MDRGVLDEHTQASAVVAVAAVAGVSAVAQFGCRYSLITYLLKHTGTLNDKKQQPFHILISSVPISVVYFVDKYLQEWQMVVLQSFLHAYMGG